MATDEQIEQEIDVLQAEAQEMEVQEEQIEAAADAIGDGNPDEELGDAVAELEDAAEEVADAALEAGRPDLAAQVVEATLTTLANWATSAEELSDVIETVAAEVGDEDAIEAAAEAAVATEEAADATEATLEEAGVPEVDAELLTQPDIAPEPSHWLMRPRRVRSGF